MARTVILGSPARLARRLGTAAAIAGVGLAASLAPAAPASALVLQYNYVVTSGTDIGSPVEPDPLNPVPVGYVTATITDNATNTGVNILFESNFANPAFFANDFAFNIGGTALGAVTATCTAGSGTTCTAPPLVQYGSGLTSQGSGVNWELLLFTNPDPGGTANTLSGSTDTLSFTVLGLLEQNFILGATNENDNSGNGRQYYSCTHVQGLTTAVNSTNVCASPRPLQDVPAPLPIFGAGVAFAYSRRLRLRIAQRRSTVRTTALA